jgi:hypothetical protein
MALRACTRGFICLILLGFATATHASQILVEQATGSGVSDSDLTTATTLITQAVGEVSSDTVVSQPDQADFVLRPTLVRLGLAYLLGLSKVKDGRIANSSQLKAARMDELDKVAVRLTRSVLAGENAAQNPRVGEITNQEARDGAQRRPARGETYLAFGGSMFSDLNSSGIGYSFAAARAWDINVLLIQLYTQFDVNGAAWMFSGGIGAKYFLLNTDFAPYLTADFGAGAAKIDGGGVLEGQSVGGFSAGWGAGFELLRTTAINLDVGFRAGYILHANQLGIPQSYALRLGIYF